MPPAGRERARDFARVAAGWAWEVDAELRLVSLTVAAIGDRATALLLGEPLTIVGELLASPPGEAPIFRARRDRAAFQNQLLRLDDGQLYRLSGVPTLDGTGQFTGFRGLARLAVTDEVADERFAAALRDELQAPLTAIVESAASMKTGPTPMAPHYADYATDIAAAGRHLLALIDGLFQVSTVGRRIAAEAVSLRGAVDEAVALIAVAAEAKNLAVEIVEQGAVCALADRVGLVQILVNLLTNAVKFTAAGGRITVELKAELDKAFVTVGDTGTGVAPEHRERVFEKFVRLDPAAEGTGLGLPIARELARNMGGDVMLDAAPEGGARFTLRLPAA